MTTDLHLTTYRTAHPYYWLF